MIRAFVFICTLKITYLLNLTQHNKKKLSNHKEANLTNTNEKMDALFDITLKMLANGFVKAFLIIEILVLLPTILIGSELNNTFIIFLFLISVVFFIVRPINNKFDEDKVYAVQYLEVRPKIYYICDYVIKLFQLTVVLATIIFIVKNAFHVDFFDIKNSLFVIYTILSGSLIGIVYSQGNNKKIKKYILGIIILIISYILLFINPLVINDYLMVFIMMVTIVNISCLIKINNFKYYNELYDKEYDIYKERKAKLKSYELNKLQRQNKYIKVNKSKNPYKNILNIFDKRYEEKLPSRFSFKFIILLIISIICAYYCFTSKSFSDSIQTMISQNLLTIIFLFSLLHSSKKIVNLMYNKCDITMDSHNFYKITIVYFKTYLSRLIYIMKKNAYIMFLMATCTTLLLYISTAQFNLIYTLIIFLIFILINFLISAYYLSLYYISNPFKNDRDKTNYIYRALLVFPSIILLTLCPYNIGLINILLVIIKFTFIFCIINVILLAKKFIG